jgi:predicted pyridoxine 5'-phosphate oxidase superfamily flavin-nucleotide-binding protein
MPAVQEFRKLLSKIQFLHVATLSKDGQPNAAPKLILKVDDKAIYLVDCTIGKTWENLKKNSKVSLSFVDEESLKGYQINGEAVVLEGKSIGMELRKILEEKEVALTVKRIVSGIHEHKKHEDFEMGMSDKFVIFKINLNEVVEIGYKGNLTRQKLKE